MDSTTKSSALADDLNPQNQVNEPYAIFNLDLDDDVLVGNVIGELNKDISHWEQAPWLLQTTDRENIDYMLGDQVDRNKLLDHQVRYVDNRLFSSVRAILAYATGQTAKPEAQPSKTDDRFIRVAKNMALMLYQHAVDHNVNVYMRLGMRNLITRKRGVLKLRFDEYYGPYGDICTENIDVADIVVDRFATYRSNPVRVYQKQRATVDELVDKFPEKKAQVLARFNIVRQTKSQMTQMVTYWECWFTYRQDGKNKEALCWFLPDADFVLGKMQNPNWLYQGDDHSQRITNMTDMPPKPYVFLNYWNTGRSFLDETCLLDQAVPLQDVLNKRGRQIVENADYANPRTLVDKRVMDESDAKKFVNKNPKTIGLVDTSETGDNINNAILTIPGTMLPSYVMQDKFDARNEIDEMMGTPYQFRGANTQTGKNPTLGQDLLAKNQANALQDDLVAVANQGWQDYYTLLLQLMKVYLPDDYWLMTKGTNGEYVMIALNDGNVDTNIRLSIVTDSTLPLDKQQQRAMAIQLAQMPGRIDDLSLFEMLGLPDAEQLAERVQRYNLDRYTYMESIEQKMFNAEAETDISLVIAGKTPEDRDDYSERYLNHWNLFIASNRFQKLPLPVQQSLVDFLHTAANKAATTESLHGSMLNPAGILDQPPATPLPKKTEQIRISGQIGPQESAAVAQPPPAPGQSPAPGSSAPSPPSVAPPPRA